MMVRRVLRVRVGLLMLEVLLGRDQSGAYMSSHRERGLGLGQVARLRLRLLVTSGALDKDWGTGDRCLDVPVRFRPGIECKEINVRS
jgi:hypothetical protein